MGAYFSTTEITNFDCLVPVNGVDITQVFFATNELFTVWDTYDGTLPAQYSANGDYLADYRMYGSAGGVGDRTENLFDIKTAVMGEYWIDDTRNTFTYYKGSKCYFIPALANTSYTVTDFTKIMPSGTFVFRAAFTNEIPTAHASNIGTTYLKQRINSAGGSKHTATLTNVNYAYLAVQVTAAIGINNNVVISEGSTAPTEYIPYGYKVDMSVQIGELLTDITQGGWDGANGRKTTRVTSGSFYPIRLGLARYYIEPQKTYTISTVPKDLEITIKTANAENIQIDDTGWGNVHTIITGSKANNLCIAIRKYDNSNITPTDVQCVKIITSEATTTPIYIGDTPLSEDEYVSFKEQKRVRFVPITSVSKAPYNSSATIVFLTPAKDNFIVQSGSTQKEYESFDISPRVQGRVRLRCLINVEKFSSYGRIIVGIRRENNTFINSIRVETLGKTYVDIDVNDVPENSYISIMATSSITNAGTYKYTVLGAEIRTSAPTDPPVPLPALPTVDGVNIVDYAGQSAARPNEFFAKYRKQNF